MGADVVDELEAFVEAGGLGNPDGELRVRIEVMARRLARPFAQESR